ncbi:glycoside hydrolase family 32 protein [Acetobacter sp. KSO5]|uniref:glycoside hydrolase family 32 protein n=1 Tax=Acetobacter sp. KSO5 TaxID=3373674 RepID=UPI00376F3C0F
MLTRRRTAGLFAAATQSIVSLFTAKPAAAADPTEGGSPLRRGKTEPEASHPEPADRPGGITPTPSTTLSDAEYRPAIHFSPRIGFMNDPNGLVHDGKQWHLYYQFDPFAPYAGRVHWGHATSPDLYHWQDQPVAIDQTAAGEAFSGSAVMDTHNSSGLFAENTGGIVALYTRAAPDRQSQYLAWSTDSGLSFTEYAQNPVLDLQLSSFRDPQVFFHAPTQRWIMCVALSRAHKIAFFGSTNLLQWTELSRFGPSGITGVDYECPNLVEIPIEGGKTAWVLFVSINPGAPQGGSATQYFVGTFDGSRFVPESDTVEFVDFAKDFYALQFFTNVPSGNPVSISWLNNWQYCQETPANSWRGVMSLPRRVSLAPDTTQRLKLIQQPEDLTALRGTASDATPPSRMEAGSSWETPLPASGAHELRISAEIDAQPAGLPPGDKGRSGRFVLNFLNSNEETLSIGFDAFTAQLWLDRGKLKGFSHPFFTNSFSAALTPDQRKITLHIVLDKCSVEVFVNNGQQTGSALLFPATPLDRLRLSATGAGATLSHFELFPLKQTVRAEEGQI